MARINRIFLGSTVRIIGVMAILMAWDAGMTYASDHLDTPSAIATPGADIGDLYAWLSPDGRRLNLVMDIVGNDFSTAVDYIFHIDSGAKFGKTNSAATITCSFNLVGVIDCRLGDLDRAIGGPQTPDGVASRNHFFRVFAGPRDDPFFNNVKGTRAAYQVASAAREAGAKPDQAGCLMLDRETARRIHDEWRQTDGGPAKNFLAGWATSALVVEIDLNAIKNAGKFLAVWAATTKADQQINRVGRPLIKNSLLGLLGPDAASVKLKDEFNAATPETSDKFIPAIEKSLAIYDSFDGICGNQILANPNRADGQHYHKLAVLLADDRLWINRDAHVCNQFLAVELAQAAHQREWQNDCGGRSPDMNASNIYRSLLVTGKLTGMDDGLDHDEVATSRTEFPFLAPPSR